MKIELLGFQGDVAIYKIDKFPEGERVVTEQCEKKILAYGELSGHCHEIIEKDSADVFTINKPEFNGLLFVEAKTPVRIRHGLIQDFTGTEADQDYHGVVCLEPGEKYLTGIVKETDWVSKQLRKVRD